MSSHGLVELKSRRLQKQSVIPQSVAKKDQLCSGGRDETFDAEPEAEPEAEAEAEANVEEVEAIEEEAFDELVDMFGVALMIR